MKGFLIQLHRSIFATLLCLIGLTIINAQMTKYLTHQETINQIILQLSRMTLKDQPGVSPYYKFGANYQRISVCSLRNLQKLEMCDMLLGDDRYQYLRPRQFKPILHCKKTEIQVASSKTYKQAFKCPTPDRTVLSSSLKPVTVSSTNTVTYTISSAPEADSVTLYYRYPGFQTETIPDMTVLNFPINHLKRLLREDRKAPYVMNRNPNRTLYHEISPQRLYEWSTKTIRNAPTAENEVFYFVRNIKKNTLIYKRFQFALHLTHLCGYNAPQLSYLCLQMIQNDAFGFEFRDDFETTNRCQRQAVYFLHSEYYGPRRTNLHLVPCHLTGGINKNSYFISTSAIQGKVLLYVRYNPHEEIIPEGYAPVELKDLHLLRD